MFNRSHINKRVLAYLIIIKNQAFVLLLFYFLPWCLTDVVARCHANTDVRLHSWANVKKIGGDFSVFSYGQSPYNRAAPFLTLEGRQAFSDGATAFNRNLVDYMNSVNYAYLSSANASACASCHFRDGRGKSLSPSIDQTGFSFVNSADSKGPSLFRHSIGADSVAILVNEIRWETIETVQLNDGQAITLTRPRVVVEGVDQSVDLRNGPAVFGLGLIEAVRDEDIVRNANNKKYEAYGVRGRIPYVNGEKGRVGRFGTKAQFATVPAQVRQALITELGIHEPPSETILSQDRVLFDGLTNSITNYLRLLAVPARSVTAEIENEVNLGAYIFNDIGCAMCHQPSWTTTDKNDVPKIFREQLIFPYSDFLLHDMGEKLTSNADSPLSRFWRTAPLWGIGVQRSVSSDAGFLHDGRARTITEAILWHGGEAEFSVDLFIKLNREERSSILQFLSSL